jgi:hypothetical protein
MHLHVSVLYWLETSGCVSSIYSLQPSTVHLEDGLCRYTLTHHSCSSIAEPCLALTGNASLSTQACPVPSAGLDRTVLCGSLQPSGRHCSPDQRRRGSRSGRRGGALHRSPAESFSRACIACHARTMPPQASCESAQHARA